MQIFWNKKLSLPEISKAKTLSLPEIYTSYYSHSIFLMQRQGIGSGDLYSTTSELSGLMRTILARRTNCVRSLLYVYSRV